jgi:hypothetical protein
MERYCSTGQSPQRAVAPKEEEELVNFEYCANQKNSRCEEEIVTLLFK